MRGIGMWAAAFIFLLAASVTTGLALIQRTTGIAWVAAAFGVVSIVTAILSVRTPA